MEDLTSPVKAFVRDRCVTGPNYGVAVDCLFDAWLKWCQDQHRDRPGTKHTFGKDLQAAVQGIKVVQPRGADGKQYRYYNGIALS
ncbi:MAG: hypothetical protein JO122_17580 [Acetobacteraceae bacterium]|nr:hypothetical protein [Acetobacteraceae bacterium]